MFKQAGVVSLLLLFSSVLGFCAQICYTAYFGADIQMDIYFALLAIPSVIVGIAPVIFTSICIPYFSSISDKQKLARSIGDIGKMVLFGSALFALCGCGLTILNIQSILPNLPPEFKSYVIGVCCLIWVGAFCGLNASYQAAVLNYRREFYLVALAALLPQLFMIASAVLLHGKMGVMSIALGYMGALLLQLILFSQKTKWIVYASIMKRFRVKSYKPLLSKSFLVLISLLPFTIISPLCYSFAADLPTGSIAYLGYSMSFAGFLSVATSMGVAVVSFPDTASELLNGNIEIRKLSFAKTERAIKMVLFISIIISGFLIVFRTPVLMFLLRRGAFNEDSVAAMSRIFPWFIVMAVCSSGLNLLRNVFYAKKEYLCISGIGIGVVLFFVFCAWLLLEYFSLMGISVALALSFILFFMVAIKALSDYNYNFLGRGFYLDLVRFIVVSGLSAGVAYGIVYLYEIQPDNQFDLFILLLLCGISYIATVFLLSKYLFRLDEQRMIEEHFTSIFIKR